MGTNSSIWIKKGEDNYKGINCHWDGYYDGFGVGYHLNEYYRTPEQVEELINLGCLSSLGENINTTKAYYRDMDRRKVIFRNKTEEEMMNEFGNYSYNYVFDPEFSKWTVYRNGEAMILDDVVENHGPKEDFKNQ